MKLIKGKLYENPKDAVNVVKESFLFAFMRYYSGKMSLTEFLIRFIRIDIVREEGATDEQKELLQIIRNYARKENKEIKIKEEDFNEKPKRGILDKIFKT